MSEDPVGYMDDGTAPQIPVASRIVRMILPIDPNAFRSCNKVMLVPNAVCQKCGGEWWPTKGTPKRCRWCKRRTWWKP